MTLWLKVVNGRVEQAAWNANGCRKAESTPRGSQWIRSGQTMLARGAASDPEFQIVAAGGMDDWDRWSESRDRGMLQSNSYRYVPQGVYGAEDLDNNGNWVNTPDYGNVWQPTVGADWAL